MAGFLDKETRVIDMVLTAEGRKLLSKGELNFIYWMPFDDEVDYDPFIADSGSLSATELSASIDRQLEATLVQEANRGYARTSLRVEDRTNVYRPIFTIPQGQTILPKLVAIHRTSSLEISIPQEKVVDKHMGPILASIYADRGYRTFNSTRAYLEYSYTPGSFPDGHSHEGFLVRVYESGSSGFREIDPRYDMDGQVSYKNDLRLVHLPRFLKDGNKI
jgi:hypothetical protein